MNLERVRKLKANLLPHWDAVNGCIALHFMRDNLPAVPKIQIAHRQVSEYQKGGMPFGLGDGLAVTVVCATVTP